MHAVSKLNSMFIIVDCFYVYVQNGRSFQGIQCAFPLLPSNNVNLFVSGFHYVVAINVSGS